MVLDFVLPILVISSGYIRYVDNDRLVRGGSLEILSILGGYTVKI